MSFRLCLKLKKIYKETEEGVQAMCEITEKLCKKSEKKGILFTLKNMMRNLGLTADKALDVCEVPKNERSFYLEKLKEVK